ncbi:MAG: glycosyltransferase family 39 protein [Anaerolineae bacterium]|nr:glycosyltransferase family 39 protein [Anaerolineae bacterium]
MNLFRRHLPAVVILALFVGLGIIYSLSVPIFESPDELYHYPFVSHMAQGGALPVQRPNQGMMWQQEGSQPPLYYFLAGALTSWLDVDDLPIVYRLNPHARVGIPLAHDNKNMVVHTDREAFPWTGAVLGIHIARLFSLLLATGTLLCTYRIALDIFPHTPILPLTALAFNAFIPMFIFISASVNNDNLVILLSSVTLLMFVRIIQRGASWRFLVLLGVTIGLACLTKLSALGLVPMAGLALLLRTFFVPPRYRSTGTRSQDAGARGTPSDSLWRKLVQWGVDCALFCVPVVLIAGWWYLRNWQLYGDPTGLNAMLDIVGRRPVEPLLADLLSEFEGLRINYWGLFGVVNVLLRPIWIYRVLDFLTVVTLIGLAVWFVQQRRARCPTPWPELLLLGAWATFEFVALIRWTSMTYASQGRLLFPAISAICLFLALGLIGWWPRRWQVWVAGALSTMFFMLSVTAPFTSIKPAYAKPVLIAATDIPSSARPLNVSYGNVARLLAYEVGKDAVRHGEMLPVTLYWQALEPTDEDISIFLQLVAGQDQVLGQVDSYPGGGAYPTSMWSPGQIFRDEYMVPLRSVPGEPLAAQLLAGLYRFQTGKRLPAVDPQGQTVDPAVLTRVKIAVPTPPRKPSHVVDANLNNAVRLVGYDLPTGPVAAGSEVPLTLYWQVSRPLGKDYTVFVHLLGDDDTLMGQGDGPPLDNAYPTSFWSAGENLADTHRLKILPDAKPGHHRIIVGLYDPASGQRLPVLGDKGQLTGYGILVTQLEITGKP